jgi:hypothetical protein
MTKYAYNSLATSEQQRSAAITGSVEFLPVNLSNRSGDVVWAKLKCWPKPPWLWEDERGIEREFAFVFLTDDAVASNGTRLVWRYPGHDVWRIWPGKVLG